MKNIYFIFLLFLVVFFTKTENTNAQQVNKNYVVLEIGTGTWCGYCPGAAMGADDLVENGHSVAVVENHNGDPYAYAGSNARNSYYGISGYPTAFFDGGFSVVGGSATSSMYGAYVPQYDAAMAIMSDFTLDMSYTHTGADYDVTIDIDEVGSYAGTNLAIHLVLTESHIPENWGGLTEVNFVNRAMYPTQTGTSYSGDATTLNLSFTANANWDLSNCELVAFIQDNTTKAILQSDKKTLAEPTGTNNVALIEVHEIAEPCFGVITPSIQVKNLGSDPITSMVVDYSMNSGAYTGTYNWSGDPIPFNHFKLLTLDDIGFELLASNSLDFDITSINGVADDDTSNNTATVNFNAAPEAVNTMVNLELHTDGWGSECTWEIRDYSNAVIESGGPYGNNVTIIESFTMPGADCYSFIIMDSYGDGGGMIHLKDNDGNTLYYTNGSYGSGETQAYKTPGAGAGLDDTVFSDSLIYPNPVNTVLHIDNAEGLNIALYDMLGRIIETRNNISIEETIQTNQIAEGTYFLKLSNGINIRTEKIVIAR